VTVITRKDYMDGKVTHQKYYAQFDVDGVLSGILRCRGFVPRLMASTDPHFNDIPLKEWDGLPHPSPVFKVMREAEATAGVSPSDWVCAYKAAASNLAGRVPPVHFFGKE
jgi:hypothetical protein